MRYLSVCSGIEAATVAWHPLGWEPAAFSEIEKFPRAVLAHHYPNVPLHGDFTTIKGDEYGPIDLICGGTPCQSFSIAGLRGGLDDDRGNLALEFLRLAQRTRARWVLWENVPGVLSSNGGRDFGAILAGLGELGYGFAYRILDAQHFGVPQRRRRIFLVGYLGDWRRAAAVLFERHGLQGHSAPRREAREAVAALTANGVGTCGADDNQGQAGHLIASTGNVPHCLNAGGMGRQDYETETLITHSLRGEGFDASEDGTGRGTPLDTTQVTSAVNYSNPKPGDPCHPLAAGAHPPAIAFSAKDYGADAMEDCSPTLRAGGHANSHANAGVMPAVAFDLRGRNGGAQFEGPHDTANLRAASGGSSRSYVAASAVRRLTPRECERLQGFPEVQKCYTILVCQNLSDQQKTNALAVLQCLKSPSNVWLADASGWTLGAEAAAHHSNTNHQHPAPHVAADVLIDLERQAVRLHSAGKSFSPAGSVDARNEFPLPTGIDSFAHLAALMTQVWERIVLVGKAELQASIKPSSPLLNGNGIAISFGRETAEPASDVANAIEIASRLSTSTTLPSGLDTETLRSILTTLSCCVVRAIFGCIPERTKTANYYAVRLTTSQGYTAIPWRGKPAEQCPDGPRYKALGNSWAVPCARWIGERIAMVEGLNFGARESVA